LAREREIDLATASNLLASVRIEPPNRAVLADPVTGEARAFEADFAFDSSDPTSKDNVNQESVYLRIGAPIAKQAVLGYNGCVIAYGQTGTGKTHTISGDWRPRSADRGLLPRLAEDLAAHLAKADGGGCIKASYLEV
jgi:Cdc6-like AAA superfamily ATPase